MSKLMTSCKAGLHTVGGAITRFNRRRDENTKQYRTINFLLTALFPLFIVCMAELNQDKYPSKFILFCVERPSVMIFNVLIASLIFFALLLLLKRGWRAMALQSLLYMTLSVVELFKFGTNGNHLILSDMRLAKSAKSLKSFAYIKITPQLVTYLLIVVAFVLLAVWFNPKQKMQLTRRLVTAGACLVSCCAIIVVPGISSSVYGLFDLDTSEADNTFQLNEKFENNSFLAFFLQTASEGLANRLTEPENYNPDTVAQCLNVNVKDESPAVKPNVITVMSEAFADFRRFDGLVQDNSAYAAFDALENDPGTYKGTAIVPTFASFTVRTEFELMFGLPVRALNDPNMPQRLIQETPQNTVISNYKARGYSTAYVHPFLSSFYSRDRVYARFGFDKMIFENDFTVDVNYFGTYIDDATVFNQAVDLVQNTDEPMYIHCTSMQNHQPYDQGEDPNAEFDNYLTWVGKTGDELTDFINSLKALDEPTVVLFIGDHYPSLKGEDSVYDQMGMNGDNCTVLYEQPYYLWSNCDLDYSKIPQENFSTFYLPYVVMDLLNAQRTSFTQMMMDKLDERPVYSTNYDPDSPDDETLDLITYDRIIGENVSGSAENEELAALNPQ